MPEVKNAFIKSKMNKDLDARLLPQGEYRNALNAQVSKSEDADEGALENILGNIEITEFVPGVSNINSIGFLTDEASNCVFVFLTDEDDSKAEYNPSANNYIYKYDISNNTKTLLVEGPFLNFHKSYPITGANLLEDLLFWTDNRNQPRKINIDNAAGGTYYTTEDQISVAKYSPVDAMLVYQESTLAPGEYETTMKDVVSQYIPLNNSASPNVLNPYYDASYPGDSKFLEDKFMRFSYRFKYEDGEYSIFAPFTQSCFIPKQDGYFFDDDQKQTFKSSIVDFMENKVNNIGLVIPLPTAANLMRSELLITEVDIISKESDGLSVSVVDTIPISTIADEGSSTTYTYNYINKEPYKTLPEKELIRVYDKTPVKALSQEIVSNRVIYGNFQSKHTPPASLNYNVAVTPKSDFDIKIGTAVVNGAVSGSTTVNINNISAGFTPYVGAVISGAGITGTVIVTDYTSPTLTLDTAVILSSGITLTFAPQGADENTTSIVEYPSSALKTNRTYQVGFVLSDRYGRQSGVILSNNKETIVVGSQAYSGSTVYAPYIDAGVSPDSWPGQSLKVLLNDAIGPTPDTDNTYWPGLYDGDSTSATYNPLGWYSYKIVIKQTEQEYYNVYTAGALKGEPTAASTPLDQETSYISLVNDNINKVPRDLSEVGPQDKSFRSSVKLYGRVENRDTDTVTYPNGSYSFSTTGNQQFYPEKNSFTVNNIQELFDLFNHDNSSPPVTIYDNIFLFYKNESDPLVGEISTSQTSSLQFGTTTVGPGTPPVYTTIENLAVFETEPVTSKLDIFWETSSTGVISSLNEAVANSTTGLTAFFSSFNTSPFDEDIAVSTDILNADFNIVDNFGAAIPISDITSVTLTSVYNRRATPQDVSSYFTLVDNGYSYNIQTTAAFISNVYYGNIATDREFDFTFNVTLTDVSGGTGTVTNTTILQEALLGNVDCQLYESNGSALPASPENLGTLARNVSTVKEFSAKNGGNSNHSGKDLTWSILSQETQSGTSVSHFNLTEQPASDDTTSYYNIINSSGGSIPVDGYTVQIQVQDPGASTDTHTVEFSLGNAISSARELTITFDNGYSTVTHTYTELTFSESASTDGVYLYEGNWTSLQNTADAANAIEVDNSTASTRDTSAPNYATCSTTSSWAYASASDYPINGPYATQDIADQCWVQYGSWSVDSTSPIDTSAYGFYIT